ncbi:MAG: TonB-dependent receptor [Candidatus Aminicenantes bacterium]|nr:TonB-dependent receptor [Candidatus Aminicenantes bacterium]
MFKKFLAFLLFGVVLALIASPAYAQRLTGSIQGTVKDETGELLPGVTLEISSPALIGGIKSIVTSATGSFHFTALPPGSYLVRCSLSGFQTQEREKIVVSIGKTTTIDLVLNPTTVEESVTVVGESPVIDVTKSGTSTTYDKQLLENIPKARFTYIDIMYWAPGISQNETSSEEWHTSLGSAGWSDNYLVDGVDTSFDWNGTTWVWNNPDIYEEGEVVSIGAPAEYGDFQGAVVNVVTKSGGNTLHAGLNAYTIPSSLVGNNVPGAEFPFTIKKNWDLGLELSGPFKKDRIWFYSNVQFKRYDYAQLGTPSDTPTASDYKRIFAKATFQLAKSHKLVLSYQHEWSKLPDVITPSQPFEACAEEPGKYGVANINLTSILSQNTVLDLKLGGWVAKDNWVPMDGNLDEPQHYDGQTGQASNGIAIWSRTTYTKLQANATLSHFADDFIHGNHEFKFGVQYTRGSSDGISSYSGGVIYYDYGGYPYAAYFQDPYNYGASINKLGVFVDDSWAVTDRLTLNLGLRFDHQDGNISEVDAIDAQRKKTGAKIKGISNVVAWNNWSPRLGLVYQLTSDKKTILKANYGHYYDGMTLMAFYRMTNSTPPVYAFLYNWDTGLYDIPFWTWEPSQGVGVDPNVKNSLCRQLSFGLSRELVTDLALELTYIYKYTDNFYSWWNTAAQYEPVEIFDEVGGKPITVYNQTTPVEDNFLTMKNLPDYKQKYRALILTLQKRLSHNWQLSSSFVWSKANGVSTLGAIAQGSRNGIQSPNDLINNNWKSLLQGDRTYMFKLQGTYFLPYDFSVSANFVAQTGKPVARMIPVTGMDQGGFSVMAEPRGSHNRLDPMYVCDLRLEKKIDLGPRAGIRISADVFNLFNADTMTQTVIVGTSESFMKPDAIAAPRRVQLSLRLSY